MKDFSLKDSSQAVHSNITVFGAGRRGKRRRKKRRIRYYIFNCNGVDTRWQ
jgi:hypothetical protein